MISRDHQGADFSTKQEISTENGTTNSKASSSSTTTASWSRFKDPRIVRVSKAFGGKDRHSKVCTVRGLRDRRVRLSVPTAIQLYDLQDRLGLNQPSKVVDWLLNVAKHEIDGLPPLQIPQGMLNPLLASSHHEFVNAEKHGLKMSEKNDDDDDDDEHESWTRSTDQEDQRQFSTLDHDQFLSRQSNNNPYNSSSFVRWDPSNLTLSHQPQLISLGLSADHHEDLQSFSLVQLPSALSVYQHGIINTQPYFPAQIPTSQPSAFHASSDQPLRPFHFSMAADLLPSQNNDVDEQNNRD